MAERRMFSKIIIDSDMFLDMPASTQVLYFHLSMRADDDGFIDNPKRIQRTVGCSDDDLKLLILKSFVITFESGVVVIRHWRIHNYIQKDRYKSTMYQNEKSTLSVDENGAYTTCIQHVHKTDTQVRLELGEDISNGQTTSNILPKLPIPKEKKTLITKNTYGEFKCVKLSDEEYTKLTERLGERGSEDYISRLDGWLAEGHKKTNHYATILNWWRKDNPAKKVEKAKQAGIIPNEKGEIW